MSQTIDSKSVVNIICSSQFGYLVDTYEYSRHLSKYHAVRYICIDQGKPKLSMPGVDVVYYKMNSKGVLKWLEFVRKVSKADVKGQVVFVKYFRFCSLLTLFFRKAEKIILDVRTGSVDPSSVSRFIFNKGIFFESLFFKERTIISSSLAKLLGIKRYKIVPLGFPKVEARNKCFDKLRLLYVGTLSNRQITDTVLGLKMYIDGNGEGVESYDIVGDGYANEVEKLRDVVAGLGLNSIIKVHGRVPYNNLSPYFDKANVGVSYVPITSYFDVQPVTKTFEYIANGMVTIGTKTIEQSKVINNINGVLCEDSPEDFCESIKKIEVSFEGYNSGSIRASHEPETWEMVSLKLKNQVLDI